MGDEDDDPEYNQFARALELELGLNPIAVPSMRVNMSNNWSDDFGT